MSVDGKRLEALVAFIERNLLPEGFTVDTNERVFNDDGVQIAEFDVEIRGKVGSTTISWLIECRDRPKSGPAPGAWIEQLVGRRSRFGFNKVTAVSTTGFASGAVEFALAQGIELREVKSLTPESFESWLLIRHIRQLERITNLQHASIMLDPSTGEKEEKEQNSFRDFFSRVNGDMAFLKSTATGNFATVAEAFSSAASGIDGLFENLEINGQEKLIQIHANYKDEDHFLIETAESEVKVFSIIFEGGIRVKETLIPLLETSVYRKLDTGEMISQVASFAPQSIKGELVSIEMHKVEETGVTHVILRRLSDTDKSGIITTCTEIIIS